MGGYRIGACSVLMIAWSAVSFGQERGESDKAKQYLEAAAQTYTLRSTSESRQFKLSENAILSYTNPTRESGSIHGASWLWLDGEKPVAACSYSIRRPYNNVMLEFSLLDAQPSVGVHEENEIWRPDVNGLSSLDFTDVPAPRPREQQRLSQMRLLAREFQVVCKRKGEPTVLRLLSQPLYRYKVPTEGVVDGALFAFVISNDPELLLKIEAVSEADGTPGKWRYSFARMTSLEMEVRRKDQVVWGVEDFYENGRSNAKEYFEAKHGKYIE
ncbi:hypothetical protein DTL42_23495 [Bremerella cremea]|uniref:Uncharacterized protein n=1 Tax=Bremerella cremea TaxID=1031537 RepID=A0A368KL83_9BACT|nr:hypothetical protein [Bremerella cremea]RCS41517.1 hypothetical protein DTL42_23495 [Bremerella cremea]